MFVERKRTNNKKNRKYYNNWRMYTMKYPSKNIILGILLVIFSLFIVYSIFNANPVDGFSEKVEKHATTKPTKKNDKK